MPSVRKQSLVKRLSIFLLFAFSKSQSKITFSGVGSIQETKSVPVQIRFLPFFTTYRKLIKPSILCHFISYLVDFQKWLHFTILCATNLFWRLLLLNLSILQYFVALIPYKEYIRLCLHADTCNNANNCIIIMYRLYSYVFNFS